MKPWYKSKTIWLAILQAISGVLLAFFQTNPTIGEVGWFVMTKSVLDVGIRLLTQVPIE